MDEETGDKILQERTGMKLKESKAAYLAFKRIEDNVPEDEIDLTIAASAVAIPPP